MSDFGADTGDFDSDFRAAVSDYASDFYDCPGDYGRHAHRPAQKTKRGADMRTADDLERLPEASRA